MDEVQDTWEMLFLQPITLKFMIYDKVPLCASKPGFQWQPGRSHDPEEVSRVQGLRVNVSLPALCHTPKSRLH